MVNRLRIASRVLSNGYTSTRSSIRIALSSRPSRSRWVNCCENIKEHKDTYVIASLTARNGNKESGQWTDSGREADHELIK